MTEGQGTTLTITRSLDVPRERVWQAWTDPNELARWWWPERFGTSYEIDLRVGGGYRLRAAEWPGIGVLCVIGTFLDVHLPERLAYTWRWEGDEEETHVTVEFVEKGGGTELCITHEGFATTEDRQNHSLGWNDCLDRLEGLCNVNLEHRENQQKIERYREAYTENSSTPEENALTETSMDVLATEPT